MHLQDFTAHNHASCHAYFSLPFEPYISLAADVCNIKSMVFANLGSMAQSNVSGWLWGMQKKKLRRCTLSKYQYLTWQNPSWFWDHLLLCCWRCWNKLWLMLLQSISSYHQTPCRDKYLHISGVGCMQIWEPSLMSKAKYHQPWIKWLAINEALWTKGFRLIIYFRVSSNSPKQYVEPIVELVERESERCTPYICHNVRTFRNIISTILVILGQCMGNPCGERNQQLLQNKEAREHS